MNTDKLEDLIRTSLDDFHRRRINKPSALKLRDTLREKNPYLATAGSALDGEKLVRFDGGAQKPQPHKALPRR